MSRLGCWGCRRDGKGKQQIPGGNDRKKGKGKGKGKRRSRSLRDDSQKGKGKGKGKGKRRSGSLRDDSQKGKGKGKGKGKRRSRSLRDDSQKGNGKGEKQIPGGNDRKKGKGNSMTAKATAVVRVGWTSSWGWVGWWLEAAAVGVGGLMGGVEEGRPGPGGWGVGQGVGAPLGVSLPWWPSRGGRMLMERSQAVASLGQCSSGALGGCMPKPWPPVA